MSGFVIALMVLRSPEPYVAYLGRRAGRILPLYLVALVLGLCTSHLYAPVIGLSYWGGPELPAFLARAENEAANFWWHIVLHLTLLHGVVPDTILPQASLAFSGPLWSISLEWQFYLVAPFLVWALDLRQPRRWMWAIATGVVVAALLFGVRQQWVGEVSSFLPLRLHLFCFGILCAVGWRRAQTAPVWLLVMALVFCNLVLRKSGLGALPVGLWSLTYLAAALHERVSLVRPLNAFLVAKPMRWIGERSYGLYVLHMPILLAVGYVLTPYMAELGKWGTAAALLAVIVLVVLPAAAFCYRWIEMPMSRISRDWAIRYQGRLTGAKSGRQAA